MIYHIEILPAAEEDIREAAKWYAKQRPNLAAEFIFEVRRAVGSLSEQALLHRIRLKKKNVRWVFPNRFPYRILYFIEGEIVKVFAVTHAKRHDRHWKGRV